MKSDVLINALNILHEESQFLVVNKPAGLVCHPTKAGPESSLVGRLRLHLGAEAVPRMIHRLDRETSGLMVVAKNPAAAAEFGKLWMNGQVGKEYLALVHGRVEPRVGTIDAPLGPDEKSAIAVKSCIRADGSPAVTRYRLERHFSNGGRDFSLLTVAPLTGRKHQIRVHLQSIGHPLVGDKLYGANELFYLALVQNRLSADDRAQLILPHQALHAGALEFPWRGEKKVFHVEPEEWFARFCGMADAPRENVVNPDFSHLG